MKPKNDLTRSKQTRPALSPSPKRFRIEKLEERIAPKKGVGPSKNCPDPSFDGRCG
jgi:hypothetical protein